MISDLILHTIRSQIRSARRILVISHIRPDGDAVGSLLGLGLSLQAVGKEIQMVLSDGAPSTFQHLEGYAQIRRHPEGVFDYVCVLDCSDLLRTGESLDGIDQPDLNIDHHITNVNFGRLNLVLPEAVATAEILAVLIPGVGLPVTLPVAEALLTGIITDSLGLHTPNMTPDTLRRTADLMEKGASLPALYRQVMEKLSYEAARFWGEGLSHLQKERGIVWTALTLQDRKAAGYPGRDDADLINIVSSINKSKISIVFVEQANGKVKVSWRAQPPYDISQVALAFGGGGHPAAAGAEITGSLDEIRTAVLQATRAVL